MKQAEREQQLPSQMAALAKCSQASVKPAINNEKADVEDLVLGSARIMEKQTRDKGKCDFENKLREIDAEIFGKADTGSNVDTADSERLLEKVESGLICNGPQAAMGQIEDHVSSVDPKSTLTQVQNFQLFQVGPTKSVLSRKGINKRCKSPTRRNPHAHATKSGKENMSLCISTV